MSDDDVKKRVAAELRDGGWCEDAPRRERLANLLDPPPPQEPEIWAHPMIARCGPGFGIYDKDGGLLPRLPWLGPKRERVSVFKHGTVEAVLHVARMTPYSHTALHSALRALDEAHRTKP